MSELDKPVSNDLDDIARTNVDQSLYTKFLNLSIIWSIWAVSCVLLYSYWYKYNATLMYNKLINDYNTKNLGEQMIIFEKASADYKDALKSGVKSGVQGIKKNLYKEMVATLEMYEKCNYIRSISVKKAFPYGDVFVACFILFGIAVVIMMSNFLNNPMSQMQIKQDIDELETEIKTLDTLKDTGPIADDLNDPTFKKRYAKLLEDEINNISSKEDLSNEEMKQLTQAYDDLRKLKGPTLKGGDVEKRGGGTGMAIDDARRRLKLLRMNEAKIKTKLAFLRGNKGFNQVTASITILMVATYLSMIFYTGATSFSKNLYNGAHFQESRCMKV